MFALAGVALFLTRAEAQQNTGGLDISVRSGIDNAEKIKRDEDPGYAADPAKRLRGFLLARVQEEPGGEKLVRPVNAAAIAKDLTRQLEDRGFHPVLPNQKPEIVITVKYGRGYLLSNPYLDPDVLRAGNPQKVEQHSNLSDSPPNNPVRMHDQYVGREEKAQRAGYEKLIIQVRAWKYPPPLDPKEKAELLWMTTMHVDDPDHLDLNAISSTMLAAGAPYFDRHIGREHEVVVNAGLSDGHVNVGTPEVVEPK
jgi:hypothetical protein